MNHPKALDGVRRAYFPLKASYTVTRAFHSALKMRGVARLFGVDIGEIQQLIYNRAYEVGKALDNLRRACFQLKALDCRL